MSGTYIGSAGVGIDAGQFKQTGASFFQSAGAGEPAGEGGKVTAQSRVHADFAGGQSQLNGIGKYSLPARQGRAKDQGEAALNEGACAKVQGAAGPANIDRESAPAG